MSNPVVVTVDSGIMIVTINRPEAKNAVNREVAEGIAAAMKELDSKAEIHLAILTGSGGMFCSGMDLKAYLRGESPFIDGRGFGGLCSALPKKPLIAAVEGFALAGGFELAIACDLIVAGDTARFGTPEVKVGLIAGAGGLLRTSRQIPMRIAMELALTGETISATRAYELGLVNRVVGTGGALNAALTLASVIAANGPLAVVASKRIISDSQDWPTSEMFAKQEPMLMAIAHSKDAIEGATAFAEKRSPKWSGC
jgi:enoyl-CoA hydratase